MSNFFKNQSIKRSPLTFYERQIIELRLRGRWKIRKIARLLGRNHSIVSREIKRNSSDGKYIASYAQERANKEAKKNKQKETR